MLIQITLDVTSVTCPGCQISYYSAPYTDGTAKEALNIQTCLQAGRWPT